MQQYMENQNELVKQIANIVWQPQTSYVAGQIIRSDSMPAGVVAVVTTAGQSGSNEPTWKTTGTVSDSGVIWTMRNIITDIDNKYAKATGVSINNNNVSINDGAFTTVLRTDVLDFGAGRKIEAMYDSEGGNASMYIWNSNSTYIYLDSYSEEGEHFKNISLSYTPATYSNSNEIATTKFVKNQNYATQTDLNSKLDKNVVADYIVDKGSNEKGWWRRWSSGWLEQGGTLPTYSSTANRQFEMPKRFADTDYQVLFSWADTSSDANIDVRNFSAWNKTDITFVHRYGATKKVWYACGYGAEE